MPRKFDVFDIERDFYAELGVSPSASQNDLRKAYLKLAIEKHPDKNKSPTATDEFRIIQEAWECLADEIDRREYDRLRGLNAEGYDEQKPETNWGSRQYYKKPPPFSLPPTDGLSAARYSRFGFPIAVHGDGLWKNNNGVDPMANKSARWEAYENEVAAVQAQRSEQSSLRGDRHSTGGPVPEERVGW